MRTVLQPLFDHMAWADSRVVGHLASSSTGPFPDVLRLLAHLVAAERVWLLRIRGEDASATPIWPDWSLDQVRAVSAENADAYAALAAGIHDSAGQQIIEYRNSQGVAFHTPLLDILMQVALHGAYHRGQIAIVLRSAGSAPINTDYITYARER